MAVCVKVVTPEGNPFAEAFAEVLLVIPEAGLDVHNKEVVAVIVIGVFKVGETGTWNIEADAAVQELSLIVELIAPDAYEIEVGEPQIDVRFENVIFAFVNAPTSAPMQS